uniref:Major facilitator superfamily (MFS) profile domain-containing protein n=1 Tax=Phlebotomus papatasi TaxID=29031 RepID=A0A1B0DDL9_PHLPP
MVFNSIRMSGKLLQFLSAIFANIGTIVYGIAGGWPSATMPILSSTDSPLPSGPLTTEEVSLVNSILAIGGMVGAVFFGWISDYCGRKWPLVVAMIPQVIAFILIATAQNTMFLYISRFLSGSILGIFYNIGIIIAYIICAYMPFYSVPYVALAIMSLFTLYTFFPESPQYLLLKCQNSAAEKSFKFFRGFSKTDQTKLEFESLKAHVTTSNTKTNLTLEDFKPASTRKAMLISYIILSGRNLSGVFPLLNYTVSIFEAAGTGFDPHISSIIVAVIQLAGTAFSAYITDKSGRRFLLISSLLLTGLCLSVMGIYFYLNHLQYDLSSISWLPVVFLSGTFFVAAGVLNVPVYILAELLPVKVRSSVATVFMATAWPQTFFIVQYYAPIAESLGVYSCMWLFAGWCFFEAIFAYFLLPETKGKSAAEIVLALEGEIK